MSALSEVRIEELEKLNFKENQLQTVSKVICDERNYSGPAPFYLALVQSLSKFS